MNRDDATAAGLVVGVLVFLPMVAQALDDAHAGFGYMVGAASAAVLLSGALGRVLGGRS